VHFEQFYAFDSTTIRLFSEVMKGVGRNPKGDGTGKKANKRQPEPTFRYQTITCFFAGK
jgi:hypothetical protein